MTTSVYGARRDKLGARRACIESIGPTAGCIFLLLITGCAQHQATVSAPPTPVQSVPQEGAADKALHNRRASAAEPPAKGSNLQPSKDDYSHLLPATAVVHSKHQGDLDADGDEDLLVILVSRDDGQKSEPRTLMIFQRNPQAKLKKLVQNERAILCKSCGGMMGDPFQGVEITSDGFLLRFEGGSRGLWSRQYRFVYSASANTWLLKEFRSAAFDKLTEASGKSLRTPEDFGLVPIERFDPAEIFANPLP